MRRVATVVAATAIGAGSLGVPAMGASSHWSTSACKSYVSSFKHKNAHPSKAKRAAANSTLKKHSCKQRV
jgi:hypothetical protein